MKISFRDNFFFFILTPLVIIVGIISFTRFIVKQDYIVGYEGSCDPSTEVCFVGCEDEECNESFYYSLRQKYGPDLYAQCGSDITDCELADECLPGDRNCSVTYCDPEVDINLCEALNLEDNISQDI